MTTSARPDIFLVTHGYARTYAEARGAIGAG
jgi:hypothetical protein